MKDKGIGEGKTRKDHSATMNQLFAAYARGKEAKELMVVLGEAALTEIDKLYAKFADAFEKSMFPKGTTRTAPLRKHWTLGGSCWNCFPEVS